MKNFLKPFLIAFLYGIGFYILQLFLHQRDMVPSLPENSTLRMWDAGWYYDIVTKGYHLGYGNQNNTAFYPLLPWIWKLTHLDAWGMSILNIIFFSCALSIFCSLYTITDSDKFIWISLPAFIFIFVPYTEALFMLSGMLMILGVKKKNKALTWISILLLSETRPVSMILFPAFLITEVLSHRRGEILYSLKSFLINYAIPLIIGFVFLVWYQYHETGELFSFFKQEESWGHKFGWPVFPLDCQLGPKTLWINSIALFVGFISLIALIRTGIKWLAKNVTITDPILYLSYLYLTAVMFIILLFNPEWTIKNTTSVHDAYRYAMASPFFWVFLYKYQYDKKYTAKDYILVFLLSNVFWLVLFASYTHIMYFIYFNFGTALLLLYMGNASQKHSLPPLIIAAINVFVQVYFFQFYINAMLPI